MSEQKFNILIVEDEGLVAIDIAARLNQFGYQIVGIADNYHSAIELFSTHKPDMVLLDINIKGDKTGIDIAKEINQLLPTPFIFITAQTDAETLEKAKNTFPSAYLVKPFSTSHLTVSIDLALHNFAFQKISSENSISTEVVEDENFYLKQDYVFIKDSNTYVKIKQNDVLFLESDGNYIRIQTNQKRYLIRCTLNRAIEKMRKPYFVRVHRSFCVNINMITKFNEQEISIDDFKIPIGRNYKEDFVKKFDLE